MQSISTSPIKLFEYLSTGKPVLSSDIIGIKTWGKDLLTYYKGLVLITFLLPYRGLLWWR